MAVSRFCQIGQTEHDRVGDGRRGFVDGADGTARFSEPQGVLVLPADVAADVGYDVVVADTVNHALRSWDSRNGQVGTLAGSGLRGDLVQAWPISLRPGTWRGTTIGSGSR